MKIICPKCGEVNKYGMLEKVRRILVFDSDNNPAGSTEDVSIYCGVPRCLECNSKVKLI